MRARPISGGIIAPTGSVINQLVLTDLSSVSGSAFA